jgi:hypothetical protein
MPRPELGESSWSRRGFLERKTRRLTNEVPARSSAPLTSHVRSGQPALNLTSPACRAGASVAPGSQLRASRTAAASVSGRSAGADDISGRVFSSSGREGSASSGSASLAVSSCPSSSPSHLSITSDGTWNRGGAASGPARSANGVLARRGQVPERLFPQLQPPSFCRRPAGARSRCLWLHGHDLSPFEAKQGSLI